MSEPVDNTCKHCGHESKFHLNERNGKCVGGIDEHGGYVWCIMNCEQFWD